MLGKLLKYEWIGFRLPFIVMLIVTLSTTLMTCAVILTIRPYDSTNMEWYSVMAFMLSFLVYYFGLIGCTLGTTLIIAIRFYKTCYTDQGYLTHTLPVSTRTILNAKIIAAAVFALTTCLAMALSLFVIGTVGLNHVIALMAKESPEMYGGISGVRRMFYNELPSWIRQFEDALGISFGSYIAYIAISFIITMVSNVMIVLGCVSLGQLYAKHRIIGAIGAYFAVQLALQVLCSFAAVPMYIRMTNNSSAIFDTLSPSLNISLFLLIATSVAMYFVNLAMMTKRLNLE